MATCTIICAWCGVETGTITVPDNDPSAGKTSHGICKACHAKRLAEMEKKLKDGNR